MYIFSSRSGLTITSSITGSFIFMFGSFFLIMGSHLGIVETMAWLPLVFLFLKRATTKKSSWIPVLIPLSLSFLAGHTPTFFVILLGSFFYVVGLSIYRNNSIHFKFKNLSTFFLILLITIGITAIFFIPAVEFHFFESVNKGVARHTGFEPPALLTLILPSLYGSTTNFGTADLDYWSTFRITHSYMYFGIFPLILFSITMIYLRYKFEKEIFVLTIIGVFAFFESMSYLTPFPSIFQSLGLHPLIRQITFWGLVQFIFAFLAAKGLDHLQRDVRFKIHLRKIVFPSIIVGIVVLSIMVLLLQNDSLPIREIADFMFGFHHNQETPTSVINPIIENAIFNLGITISFLIFSFLIVWYFIKKPKSKLLLIIVLIFIISDLSFFGINGKFYTVDASGLQDSYGRKNPHYEAENNFIQIFNSDESIYRYDVNAPNGELIIRNSVFYDMHGMRGYLPNYLSNYDVLLRSNDLF